MTKKLVARKGRTSSKPKARASKPKKSAAKRRAGVTSHNRVMKGGVVAHSIKAGRDVVTGDQYNYNYDQRQIANINSAADFIADLQKVQAQIEVLKQSALTPAQTQTIEVVEGQIKGALTEAQKPQPLGARITATLTDAQAVMDTLGKSIASAVGLGAALAGLGQVALRLFGG